MKGLYEIVLRAPDGRERKDLFWLPTEETRRDLLLKARLRGLDVKGLDA